MEASIRIACANVTSALDDIQYNMRVMRETLIKAKNSRVDLLLFGEAFLQGFEAMSFSYADDVKKAIFQKGVEITKIRAWAKEYQMAVGFGYYENDAGGLYSSYLFIDEEGRILDNYRRVSTGWRIKKANPDYRCGRSFQTFTWRNLRLTTLVCGDFWEDKLLTAIVTHDHDSDLFLWPVHCDYTQDQWDNEACDAYRRRTEILKTPILFYNNYIDEKERAKGGAYLWHQGKTIEHTPYGSSQLSIFTFSKDYEQTTEQ